MFLVWRAQLLSAVRTRLPLGGPRTKVRRPLSRFASPVTHHVATLQMRNGADELTEGAKKGNFHGLISVLDTS